jgi:Tol biopolymer transport system component
MSDLDDRFTSLDRVPVPELWPSIERRDPGDAPDLGGGWRRVGVGAVALTVAAAGVGFAAVQFSRTRAPSVPAKPSVENGPIAFIGSGFRRGFEGPKPKAGSAEIYLVGSDGSGYVNLSQSSGEENSVEWSTDGSELLVARLPATFDRRVRTELYILDRDGRPVRQVTHPPLEAVSAAFSPDGSRVAFIGLKDDKPGLFVVNSDGTHVERLATNPPDPYGDVIVTNDRLSWSPDGRQIVFSMPTWRIEGPGCPNPKATCSLEDASRIYVIDAEGQRMRRITDFDSSSPSWSPDGRLVAFSGGSSEHRQIYTMAPDGSDVRPITEGPFDTSPDWSPDGNRLVFEHRQSKRGGSDLYTVNPDGSQFARLTNGIDAEGASWGPAPSGSPVPGPTTSATPRPSAEVSATTADGDVTCSASLASALVQPGEVAMVRFRIENHSTSAISFNQYPEWTDLGFSVRDDAGDLLWSKRDVPFYEGPHPLPVDVAPGATGSGTAEVAVRWGGALHLEPFCSTSHSVTSRGSGRRAVLRLPELELHVAAPGQTPDLVEAIGRAVDSTDGLFADCVPSPGAPAVGDLRILTDERSASLSVRCIADTQSYPGLVTVTLRYVHPADAPLIPIPTDRFSPPKFPVSGPYETGAWTFVVTRDYVREVVPLFVVGSLEGASGKCQLAFGFSGGHWKLNGSSPEVGGSFLSPSVVIPSREACPR